MACNETAETPLTLNPFMEQLLKQLIAYAVTHVEEIIAMIMELFSGEPSHEVKEAIVDFRMSPNTATFNALTNSVGLKSSKPLAAKIINKAQV